MSWFDVDKDGLAKLLEQRGKAFAIFELWQNAMDEDTKNVTISLTKLPGSPYAVLTVEDDSPDGFKDIRHAFTLFAESSKKGDPKKRGWMNFGEKLVLACCRKAKIETTTGTVTFDKEGRRVSSKKRDRGSIFTGEIRMNQEEYDDALKEVKRLIPPPDKRTVFNGEALKYRPKLTAFEYALPTRVAGPDGTMTKTIRTCRVDVYEPLPGEVPSLYEMGIPVVETNDKYSVDVQQKVPLNMDRDNVPPSYLRTIRAIVLNQLHDRLTEEDASTTWVREAASSPICNDKAITTVLGLRYGDKRVSADPSDREAEGTAKAHGYSVVHGGSLTAGEWENAKRAGAIQPAGQVYPTPKPFHPGGKPLKLVPEGELEQYRWWIGHAKRIASHLLGHDINVVMVDDSGWGFAGACDGNVLYCNVDDKDDLFFVEPNYKSFKFLLHELAHAKGGHLEASYHEALEEFGADLTMLALEGNEVMK